MKNMLSIASCLLLSFSSFAEEPTKLRWVIAHEPISVFQESASHFEKAIEKHADGKLDVEVSTRMDTAPSHYRSFNAFEIIERVHNGDVEMAQVPLYQVAHFQPEFYALDLPFAFNSYPHAEAVYDGEIGNRLLASLTTHGVRGLAFTYSGGNLSFVSKGKAIRTAADFKGRQVRTYYSPIALETMRALGATAFPFSSARKALNYAQSSETAIASQTAKALKERGVTSMTQSLHRHYITVLVINEKFYKSLSPKLQKAVSNAAREAARIERQQSIKDEAKIIADIKASGIEYITMSDSERAKMKKMVKPVIDQYRFFYGDLPEKIQAVKPPLKISATN
jgi:TRAP-type C4-dicarboxylate transport system substrate-binding protein